MVSRHETLSDIKLTNSVVQHARVKSVSSESSTNLEDQVSLPDTDDKISKVQNSITKYRFETTDEAMQACHISSQPINIPGMRISAIDTISEEQEDFCITSFPGTPPNSVGDTVYDSPKLPRPSNDFNHVMVKLRKRGDLQRVRSCDDVVLTDSEGELGSSPCCISSSLPSGSVPQRSKGRRSVRFDETTITLTAELGESAARFRSRWRKKRVVNNMNRFGESRNIIVQHSDDEIPSPQLDRTDKTKSIFDICNYSSYGRYT